jgi:hypothetical protein
MNIIPTLEASRRHRGRGGGYPRTRDPHDYKEVMPEVHLDGDITGWTCVASSFAGHRNICKS